ncbi:type II toxin-antitoxin system HicB family antitoxin [Sphingomonas quercus]|nr:type II toxin-antitoxin system HicB family antitoxin [Sphingomonas quercus]
MFEYPVEIARDDDGSYLVTFPDVPEAVTFGETEADALARAVDALETALMGYMADWRPLPPASAANGRPTVMPDLLSTLKLAVYAAMRERDWRKADLARAMALNPRQIDRLLDLRHASTVAQLDQALRLCGRRVVMETAAVAA